MNTPTDRALAVVRRMSIKEREMIRHVFAEYIPSTDSVWLDNPWTVSPTELDVALTLVAERGY